MRCLTALVAILWLTAAAVADEPPKAETKAEKPQKEAAPPLLPPGAKPVPLYILTRQDHFQHFYSISKAEVDNLTSKKSVDPHGIYRYHGILGYGSSKPGDGLTKLNRVLLTQNGASYATFYVKAPRKLNPRAKVHPFPIWVWEKKQPGLVPVYGISDDNWRNLRFITNKKTVKQALDQAYKTRRVRLKNHGIMFYIMPAKPNPAKKPANETAGKDQAKPESAKQN